MSESVHRRDFMKQAGGAALALGAAAHVGSRTAGANSRITAALVGANGRGAGLARYLTQVPDVEVAYVCDVDERAIAKGQKAALQRQKAEPRGLTDFRKALEDRSLDAVVIASPDHWHAPMAILALAAGKHVYLEKPCSHSPHEGELLIQAVKKSGKVFQMGTQRRSFPNVRQAVGEIHGGAIGRTYFGRTWYVNNRGPIGRGKPAPVPSWLDYDLWQGPAPRVPYRDNVVHYNWHWFWHWGTGEALNNGTHEVDVCRWAMQVDWPTRVSSSGGRYQFDDDWETPDTQVISMEFPSNKAIAWEGRSCNAYPVEGLARGVMVHGTEGSALLDDNAYTIFDKKNKVVKKVEAQDGASASGLPLDTLHVANFMDAIRKGTPVTCPVEEAHKSTGILQLGNIAQRVGRTLHCDVTNGHIQNDPEAMKLWSREYEKGWEPRV
jgi:predicted dehydrogenase